jgi:hypothetical protein
LRFGGYIGCNKKAPAAYARRQPLSRGSELSQDALSLGTEKACTGDRDFLFTIYDFLFMNGPSRWRQPNRKQKIVIHKYLDFVPVGGPQKAFTDADLSHRRVNTSSSSAKIRSPCPLTFSSPL